MKRVAAGRREKHGGRAVHRGPQVRSGDSKPESGEPKVVP
ncbi:hypothetical protein QF030_000716 [Streptomyces rishiriensis]|uniref:Uncharacterized protein n=1 Tax=Streptomyces rishiriensis TaxID=68264 RepID=A0ABU0NHF2_STRRH|nr:hypothetical protein [Streptomyces rishiriensis]